MALNHSTIYVRAGVEDLAIPDCSGVFNPGQANPITDTKKWIDQFFAANSQRTDSRGYGESTRMWLNPTMALGILSIYRHLPISRTNNDGWIDTHEIASYARTPGPSLYPVLRIENDRREEFVTVTVGDESLTVSRSHEQDAREPIQSAMRAILADLGYGTPEEFSEKAMPLEIYQSERNIGPKLYVP